MSESSSAPVAVEKGTEDKKANNDKPGVQQQACQHWWVLRWVILSASIAFVAGAIEANRSLLPVFNGVATAVATIVIAVFTRTLYHATRQMQQGGRDTLDHQVEATERDQRGYVMYKESKFRRDGSLVMVWCNFGKTPVKDVEAFVYRTIANYNAEGKLPEIAIAADHAKICIAPGAEYWIDCRLRTAKKRRLGDAIRRVATGQVEYLHGRVEYTDAFDKRRHTWFKYWIRRSDLTPQNCQDGNDWD